MSELFESIRAGLLDAIAFSKGEPNGCTVHQPPAESEQATPPKGCDVGSNPTRGTKLFS